MLQTLLVISLVASGARALQINTPASVVECQPVALSWSNATLPVYLAVIPGGDTSTTLENLDTITSGDSYTWTCDIAAGTSIGFRLTDSTGLQAYTDELTVQAGSSSSCVSTSSASSASSGISTSSASESSAAALVSSSSSTTSHKSSTSSSKSASSTSSAAASSASTNDSSESSSSSSSSTSGAEAAFSVGGYLIAPVLVGMVALAS